MLQYQLSFQAVPDWRIPPVHETFTLRGTSWSDWELTAEHVDFVRVVANGMLTDIIHGEPFLVDTLDEGSEVYPLPEFAPETRLSYQLATLPGLMRAAGGISNDLRNDVAGRLGIDVSRLESIAVEKSTVMTELPPEALAEYENSVSHGQAANGLINVPGILNVHEVVLRDSGLPLEIIYTFNGAEFRRLSVTILGDW
jgi:hypothetical protein